VKVAGTICKIVLDVLAVHCMEGKFSPENRCLVCGPDMAGGVRHAMQFHQISPIYKSSYVAKASYVAKSLIIAFCLAMQTSCVWTL
jgi:hypothetical protein